MAKRLPRRQFCAALGALAAVGGTNVCVADPQSTTLRVIAYNVFGCMGWPAQRRLSKQAVVTGQMAKRLATELAIHKPDILAFSESPSEQLTQEIAELLGMNHVRFPSGGNWPGTLLSRFEIIDSQNCPLQDERPKDLFTRHWGRATIELPNGEPLIVHSAHLYPTIDPTIRLREIEAMLEAMKADLDSGCSMLLLGDLNHGPDSAEYRNWMAAGWVDSFARVGRGKGFTITSDIPKWRVDYVMARGSIADQMVESKPLFEGAFRLNINDKESFALSDHLPQLAVFELSAH